MTEKILVKKGEISGNELLLLPEDDPSLTGLKALGQMLVDSDHLSFIYIAEKDDVYTYIVLSESTWIALNKAITENIPVFVTNGQTRIELSGIHGELTYLIENIKGNSNYGVEMVAKVESTF